MPYKSRKKLKSKYVNDCEYYNELNTFITSLYHLPKSKSFASIFGEDVDQVMFYICHYLIFINSLFFGTLAISDCQLISSKLVSLSQFLCGYELIILNLDAIMWEEIAFGMILWYQNFRLGCKLQYDKVFYSIIDMIIVILSFSIISMNKDKISDQLMTFYANINTITVILRQIYYMYPAKYEYDHDEWATELDLNDFLNLSKEPSTSFWFYCINNVVYTMNIWFLELLALSFSLDEVKLIDHFFTMVFTGSLLYFNSRSMFLGYASASIWRKWFARDVLMHMLQIMIVYRSSNICMHTIFGSIYVLINIINTCLRAWMLNINDEKIN